MSDLIKELEFWRCERPSEWKMDDFIRGVAKLEQANRELQEEGINNTNILNQEIDKWKQANKELRDALEQIRDDDQLRGFQYQDIAREALEDR